MTCDRCEYKGREDNGWRWWFGGVVGKTNLLTCPSCTREVRLLKTTQRILTTLKAKVGNDV